MKKPNILLITTDQQHYSMLGAVNKILKTPNLDRLADEGMRFERAYCANPTCSPSRASILTGMYPSKHGCWSLGTKLPESTETLSAYLKDNGYATALIGKAHFQPTKSTSEYPSIETPEYMWDLDFWRNFHKDFYGFEHIELLRNHTAEHWAGQHYVAWLEDNGYKNWRKYFFRPRGRMRNRYMGRWNIPEKYHYNTFIAERTNAMLEEYKREDKPFFLWASFPDPHYPQLVPAPWDKMYDPKDIELPEFSYSEHEKNPPYFAEVCKRHPKLDEYRETGMGVHGLQRHYYNKHQLKRQVAYAYGMMSFTDKYIGIILDKLKSLGLENDTLIIFTTDHGDLFGQHGLRHKCIFHYEDLLRVPMIVKYNGHIPKGAVNDSLQSLIDLAPTILDYCGLAIPQCMQGIDERAVWDGRESAKRTFVINENRHEPHVMHMVSYIENDYKITVHEGRTYGELYDLKNDPEEHNDIWQDSDARNIKAELLYKFLVEEMKMDGDTTEYIDVRGVELFVDLEKGERSVKFCGKELWDNAACIDEKIEALLAALSRRIGRRELPMPRIAGS